jgi:FkbM family methyltransferase
MDLNPVNWARRVLPRSAKGTLKRLLGLPATRLHPDWSILAPIGPVNGPHVVLDAGAHHGWFFHCWKAWCPAAVVHAFEPTEESYRAVAARYHGDPAVKVNRAGLSAREGTMELHVMRDSMVSNSFLPHLPAGWEEVAYHTGEVTRRTVPVTTVDAYCRSEGLGSVYLLKIDVQGWELEVLRGAEQTLPCLDHVFVESAIRPLYADAPRFTAVADFLLDRGFYLAGWRAWHRGNHALVEADMLFRRTALMPPVNERIDRVYEQARG